MRMRLHVDSTIGDEYIYPIYNINYDTLAALPNFITTIGPVTAEGYTIHKFYVQNDAGLITTGIPATVPRFPEQTGNILPQRFAYTEELGGIKYLEHWFDSDYWQVLGTQPADWATGTNYAKVPDTSGTYRYVITKVAQRSDSFVANASYLDKKRMICRAFYTDKGGHFAVFKGGSYDRTTRYTCQWAAGRPPMNWNDTTAAIQQKYMFVSDKTGNVFNTSFYISRTTEAADAGLAYNSNFVFVHYKVSATEFYGIAEILYDGWTDNPTPIRIMVCGIDASFWADNLYPGGDPGQGTWGSKTQIGGGQGSFDWPSDIRGDGTGAIGEAIATEARSATDAFFTGSNGFKLHQILAADIPDIYGALYSSSFLDRYQHAMYSPLSAVLSVHMIPQKLLDLAHATTNSDLTLSGYNVSTQVTNKQYPQIPTVFSYHLAKITLDATDTYMDYAP